MSVDCIVADDNPLLNFISIKNLNLYVYIVLCAKQFGSDLHISNSHSNYSVGLFFSRFHLFLNPIYLYMTSHLNFSVKV